MFSARRGGTLFLDEIGEAPAEVQVHLLRALETGRILAVGGEKEEAVDVRIIAAADADLESEPDALGWALEFQETLAQRAEESEDFAMEGRAAIHLAEVVLRRNAPVEIERGARAVEMIHDDNAERAVAMVIRLLRLASGRQTLLTGNAFDLARQAAGADSVA